MRTVLYAYNQESQSAKLLSEELGIKRVRHENSRFQGRQDDQLINWGCGNNAWVDAGVKFPGRVINNSTQVNLCSNKLKFFKYQQQMAPEVSLVPWTVNHAEAQKWIQDGRVVVAREVLQGHSGEGIRILQEGLDFCYSPLYTMYIPKKAEYRVHIVAGEVIDIQQKIRDPEKEPQDWRVRSHQNGFIFARNDINPNEGVVSEAKKSFQASGLDFGAIDVIWNEKQQKAYILEINSAPGLEGVTVKNYAEAFRKYFNV